MHKRRTASLVIMCLWAGMHVPPAKAQNVDSLKQMMEKANRDAQALGERLHNFLGKSQRCENGNDASAVPEFDSFIQHLALAEAMTGTFEIVGGIQRSRTSNAQLRLDIADTALASNCIIIADELYRSVLKFYTESRFLGLREVAKIGVEDVRDRKRAIPSR